MSNCDTVRKENVGFNCYFVELSGRETAAKLPSCFFHTIMTKDTEFLARLKETFCLSLPDHAGKDF
jgi:hypothetical protein